MKIEAVLLDFDGTLIKSHDAWFEALNSTIEHHGKKRMTREYFDRHHVGTMPEQDILTHIPDLSGDKLKEAMSLYGSEFVNKADHIKPHVHAVEILEYITSIGKKIGLVTTTGQQVLDPILENLKSRGIDMKKHFQVIVTGDNIKRKPEPDPYLKACEVLGVEPENVIVVEDSAPGVKSSKVAGCYTVAVTHTTPEEELRKAGADRIINGLAELKEIIKN